MFFLLGRGMERGGEMPRLPACLLALALIVTCPPKNSRAAAPHAPAPRYTRGVLAKYAKQVSSSGLGAVTD